MHFQQIQRDSPRFWKQPGKDKENATATSIQEKVLQLNGMMNVLLVRMANYCAKRTNYEIIFHIDAETIKHRNRLRHEPA